VKNGQRTYANIRTEYDSSMLTRMTVIVLLCEGIDVICAGAAKQAVIVVDANDLHAYRICSMWLATGYN